MSSDIGTHSVCQFHRIVNIPAKSDPNQDSRRASIACADRMMRSLCLDRAAQIKFSIARKDNGSLSASCDNNRLNGKMFEKRFHSTPDPIKSPVRGALDP